MLDILNVIAKGSLFVALGFLAVVNIGTFVIRQRSGFRDTFLHLRSVKNQDITFFLKFTPWMKYLRTRTGCLPLHYACSSSSTCNTKTSRGIKNVRPLVEAYPDGVCEGDRYGFTPLHYAVHRGVASVDVIQCLIDARPLSPVLSDTKGYTPLHDLWSLHGEVGDWSEFIASKRRSNEWNRIDSNDTDIELGLPTEETSLDSSGGGDDDVRSRTWRAMCAMVRSVYPMLHRVHESASRPPDLSSSIVHYCAGLGDCCPVGFLELAMSIHPDEVKVPDENGELPLNIAARAKWSELSRRESDGTIVWGDELCYSPDAVPAIVKAYPEAARHRNKDGRLPINVAIASGLDYNAIVTPILRAAPEVLRVPDEATALYPFMLSASNLSKSKIDTTYQLLRADPSLLVAAGCV